MAVFCGSSTGFSEEYARRAEDLGRYLARSGIGMVYGGGKIGLMGAIADAIIDEGGEVIGVIPGLLRHEEVAHARVERMIVTRKMSKRKVRISKLVDGYIAMPGGFGTLDEVFEALTLGQLGIESKPVGLLNVKNYYDPLLEALNHAVREGFIFQDHLDALACESDPERLLEAMRNHRHPHAAVKKWLRES